MDLPIRVIHLLDQLLALDRVVCAALHPHFLELRRQGWTEEQAFQLCENVQMSIVGPKMDEAEAALQHDKAHKDAVEHEIAERVAAEVERRMRGDDGED